MVDHFDITQFRMSVGLPLSCYPSPCINAFTFRLSEVTEVIDILLDLDPYGGTDQLGMFLLFLKKTADVLASRLSVVFRRLSRLLVSLLA